MSGETKQNRASGVGAWLLGVTLVLVLGGCATSQVKGVTAGQSSEKASLAQLPLPDATGTTAASAADAPQHIDEIIGANPNLTPATIASLRIRQGVLYLDRGEFNQAAAAFDAADATLLVTPRDQALREVAPDLIWWFRTAPLPNIPGAETKRAEAVMQSLNAQVAKRWDSPDIRDYLAEVRAWVGLKYFAALSSRSAQKKVIEDTIDQYATIFSKTDLAWLCAPSSGSDGAAPEDVRRRLRAEPVIQQAGKYARVLTAPNQPTFREPVMQDLIAPSSPTRLCQRT